MMAGLAPPPRAVHMGPTVPTAAGAKAIRRRCHLACAATAASALRTACARTVGLARSVASALSALIARTAAGAHSARLPGCLHAGRPPLHTLRELGVAASWNGMGCTRTTTLSPMAKVLTTRARPHLRRHLRRRRRRHRRRHSRRRLRRHLPTRGHRAVSWRTHPSWKALPPSFGMKSHLPRRHLRPRLRRRRLRRHLRHRRHRPLRPVCRH